MNIDKVKEEANRDYGVYYKRPQASCSIINIEYNNFWTLADRVVFMVIRQARKDIYAIRQSI